VLDQIQITAHQAFRISSETYQFATLMVNEAELKLRFRQAQFIKSIPTLDGLPPDVGVEIAFAGRSNAGKSSAINALTEHPQLARVSKTPGRTQHLVFFDLSRERRLVDLPGYGYAKVPEAMRLQWREVIDGYLRERKSLRALVLMMDIRLPMTPFDEQMLAWAHARGLDIQILLTKADKLNRGPGLNVLLQVQKELKARGYSAQIELFSAPNKQGVQPVRWQLAKWLEWA
jgi:GTP-binding protein